MFKRVLTMVLVATLLLVAGCSQLISNPANQSLSESTASAQTAVPLVVVVTSTPSTPTDNEAAQTPLPVERSQTPTPAKGSITITKIEDVGLGRAIVHWDAVGEFPAGFKVVWSDVHQNPSYPEDTSAYTSDSLTRAAMIAGNSGKIYFVRVCRFANDKCDMYSNLGIFALFKATATPFLSFTTITTPQYRATSYNSSGESIVSSNSILINSITDDGTGSGKAQMTWSAAGTFTNGFRIMFSSSTTTPTFGNDSYYVISDGTSRVAYIDGTPGSAYYYRICRYTGSTCDIYSATYTFTFSGSSPTSTPDLATISILSITDTTSGNARIDWSATGTFPGGFKIFYSKTNPPTLSDSVIYVSNGSLRTAGVTGDPEATYYFRICKYSGSGCVVYSPVFPFTFAPRTDTSTIAITSITELTIGYFDLYWEAIGDFPDGYFILFSDTNPDPEYVAGSSIAVSNKYVGMTLRGMPGKTIYIRLCKSTGSGCGIYSNSVSITMTAPPIDTALVLSAVADASGFADLSWTLPDPEPDGYYLLRMDGTGTPVYPDDALSSLAAGTSSILDDTVGAPGTLYSYRICDFDGLYCVAYSNVVAFTVPSLTDTPVPPTATPVPPTATPVPPTNTPIPVTITNLSHLDTSDKNATINWDATGVFTDGFKVFLSTTNPPTLDDTVVTVSDGSLRTAPVSGTAAGLTYYLIVCQYDGVSACLVSSSVYTFTFAQITSFAVTETGSGTADLSWAKAGDFPSGYRLLYSTTVTNPDFSTGLEWLITIGGSDLSASISGATPGDTYYFRLCQKTAAGCAVYSDAIPIVFSPATP